MKIAGKQVQAISVEVDPSEFLDQLYREWLQKVIKDEKAFIMRGEWNVNYRNSSEVERAATEDEIKVNDAFLLLMSKFEKK